MTNSSTIDRRPCPNRMDRLPRTADSRRTRGARLDVGVILALAAVLFVGCGGSAAIPTAPSSSSTASPPSVVPSARSAPTATPSPVTPAEPTPTAVATLTPVGSGPPDPANFSATIDNPWFPLTPGTTLTYRGTKDGKAVIDVFRITNQTMTIAGVKCRVVDDQLWFSGKLGEKTSDYYTQDKAGNVWYFGEDTEELDANGKVTSREGTWRTGRDGATPGIFMEATPTVGHAYPQEFYAGHAEDHFQVVSLAASITVPFGAFSNALETKEWTPLEPGVLDRKVYVIGIGEVLELAVKGPLEKLELVKVDRP
jgi:hypothetical protein